MDVPGGPPDRIILQGIRVYGYHGVPTPKSAPCWDNVLLGGPHRLELDLRTGRWASDRLEDTVSYSHVYRAVRAVVEGEPRNLLESAAQAIADRVLAEFPVEAVTVTVKKPNPPVRGSSIELAAIRIHRTREGAPDHGA